MPIPAPRAGYPARQTCAFAKGAGRQFLGFYPPAGQTVQSIRDDGPVRLPPPLFRKTFRASTDELSPDDGTGSRPWLHPSKQGIYPPAALTDRAHRGAEYRLALHWRKWIRQTQGSSHRQKPPACEITSSPALKAGCSSSRSWRAGFAGGVGPCASRPLTGGND